MSQPCPIVSHRGLIERAYGGQHEPTRETRGNIIRALGNSLFRLQDDFDSQGIDSTASASLQQATGLPSAGENLPVTIR